jgi:hypothetical protein
VVIIKRFKAGPGGHGDGKGKGSRGKQLPRAGTRRNRRDLTLILPINPLISSHPTPSSPFAELDGHNWPREKKRAG